MVKKLMNISELVMATGLSRSTLNRMRSEGMPCKEGVGTRKYDLEEVKIFIAERAAKNGVTLNEGRSYTNAEIVNYFRVGNMGGMRKSNTQNAMILISKAEDPTPDHEYDDFFDDDGILHYTGMGQEGDQKYTHGNKILGDSQETGITVHLFMRHGVDDYVYRGVVTLAGEVYEEVEPDKRGNLRKVFKFPLSLESTESFKASECKANEVKRIREKRAEEKDLKSLYEINEKILDKINANEKMGNPKTSTNTKRSKRDPDVAEYVKRRAGGVCQLCGARVDADNVKMPIRLVCHHEPPLSRSKGRDDKLHAAAICDNCHARRHSEGLSDSVLEAIINIINANIKDSEERMVEEFRNR